MLTDEQLHEMERELESIAAFIKEVASLKAEDLNQGVDGEGNFLIGFKGALVLTKAMALSKSPERIRALLDEVKRLKEALDDLSHHYHSRCE